MNEERFVSNLRKLCLSKGISGQEQEVVRQISSLLNQTTEEKVQIDSFGNLAVRIPGKGEAPSIMLVAHSDEVGGIVNDILSNGLLAFRTVGCVSKKSLPATRVSVGDLPGTISASPAHLEVLDSQSTWDLQIDIGALNAEDAFKMGVNIGDPVTFSTDFVRLGLHRVCSRAIDDRVGCAILLELLSSVEKCPAGDIIFAFSVREETTMSGSHMLAQRFEPNCCLAIDTVPSNDTESSKPVFSIGNGPVLQLMEGVTAAYVGNSVHPGIKKALLMASEKGQVPVQLCAEVGSWTTDGSALHRANEGVPTGYVSIPRRYAHSSSEVMDLRDAFGAINLLEALINNMSSIDLRFI